MSNQINNLFPFLGFEDKALMTEGTLSLFFKTEMYDKDSLGSDDKLLVSDFLRDAIESLGGEIMIQQYFIKHKSQPSLLGESVCDESRALVYDHVDFFNQTDFYQSSLYWVFTLNTDFTEKLSPFLTINKFLGFLFGRNSYQDILNTIDEQHVIQVSESKLSGKLHSFLQTMERFKLQMVSKSDFFKFDFMEPSDVIGLLKFFSSFDSKFLYENYEYDDSIGMSLATPEIDTVLVSGANCIRHKSALPVYSSIGSLIRFIGRTSSDFWTQAKSDLLAIKGEFIVMCGFKPYSTVQKITSFHAAKVKTEQVAHNPLKKIIRGGDIDLEKENPIVHERLKKLNDAKNWDLTFGEGVFSVIPFSTDSENILPMRAKIESSVFSGNARMVWESHGQLISYHSLIPSCMDRSCRKLKINSHQFAALSMCYTQNNGIEKIDLLKKDKPLCYFHTTSGERVAFSPYVGQKSLMIGVGDTRGGKTYLKNFISSMLMQWGAKVSYLDIDEGSYPVANHFKSQSSIYRLPQYSYNPFDDFLKGVNDHIFYEHILNLCRLTSSNPLSNDDCELIERCLVDLLSMPEKMHNMGYFLSMLPIDIRSNFSRFTDGIHDSFFSNEVKDKLSNINCFNLEAVYELDSMSQLAYYTLLFQIVNDFKFRTPRHIPKYLFIDEAHSPLKSAQVQNMIDNNSRTGNKYLIGLSLFTQNAYELGSLDFWPALRTACATFIFVSNPEMDDEHYKSTFKLSDYEVSEIKKLIPRKEFYLIQREANISKRLEFNPSPYYQRNFTSNPIEIHQNKERAVL